MRIPRDVHSFALDTAIIAAMMLAALFVAARAWLAEHPQHDLWAPLDLNHPQGWATQTKLAALRDDPQQCRAVLERSNVAFSMLAPAGEGECRREDRTVLAGAPLSPMQPVTTCAVAAGIELWLRQSVQRAAQENLGASVRRIEHFGAYSCRRIYGGQTGNWSEHATGNAIDIGAFVLDDGRRVSVAGDWQANSEGESEGVAGRGEAAFLRAVRDEACGIFATVLSPDYNEAHNDHFHLGQQARGLGGFCR